MPRMNREATIAALDEELARLRKARALLSADLYPMPAKLKPGRPPKVEASIKPAARKRFFSDEARQRIIDGQKRRWAAQKAR
jgi:hypothetical protein